MLHQFSHAQIDSFFGLTDDLAHDQKYFWKKENVNLILWNRTFENIDLQVDLLAVCLKPNELLTTTYLQKIFFQKNIPQITAFGFNREFYCLLDHDHEVSCNGILFFGTQDLPIIRLPKPEILKFNLLYEVFLEEFQNTDNIQEQMLQMLLKRLIIKCTRLAKEQCTLRNMNNQQVETIRKFNLLVDMHFRTHKQVQRYADMLHKSPKTLSNLFTLYSAKTPLQIIHERIVLEAKRLLQFTDKNIREIAEEMGYEEANALSKIFKKTTGNSMTEFKESKKF